MDFIRKNSKNILIGLLFLLFIGACIIIVYLLNTKKLEVTKEITGEVIIADKEYLMIESNNENYLINNIKGNYEVGDKIKFTYNESELNSEKNPKEIKVKDEDLITKKPKEDNKEDQNTNKSDNPTSNKTPNYNNNNISKDNNSSKPSNNSNKDNNLTNNINNKEETADQAIMSYMNNLETEMNKPSLGESAKKGFITVIDFLFYKGSIKGHTFNELSSSVKLKVLSMALYFDSKIDKYFPGYKESISSTTKKIYTNIKESIISSYLEITTSICQSNSELCNNAKDGFASLKKNFGLTFDLIKEIAGDGLTNLKNWYEIWSGK